jgi:hypothetical protein
MDTFGFHPVASNRYIAPTSSVPGVEVPFVWTSVSKVSDTSGKRKSIYLVYTFAHPNDVARQCSCIMQNRKDWHYNMSVVFVSHLRQ